MNLREKSNFRQTAKWKKFRLEMVNLANNKCQLCGVKKSSKGLDVHHRFPDEYFDITPDKFKVLCTDCHAYVERSALRLGGKDPFPRREVFLAWIGDFLPHSERTVDALMAQMRPVE